MAGNNSTKNKHLTLDDRLEIQGCLDHGATFKAIGQRVCKDQTTISKEVKKHIFVTPRDNVKRTDEYGNPIERDICPSLLKAPFVCNACKKRHVHCPYQKQLYRAREAHRAYESLLSEAREGIPLNKEDFYEVDKIVSNGIKQGQHLYHIMQTHDLPTSKSSVYRHLKRGYLSVCAIDFPRVPKFKPRKQKHADYVPKAAKVGRTYDDFLTFTEEHNIVSRVEMDTVIGHIGGKVIMTFDFTFCNFMFGILLENKTALEAAEKFKTLKTDFVANELQFGDVFPLLLTDNGGEFANIAAFENNLCGEKETSLFFCDPYNSSQKPKVEKNHTLFRDIVPKGTSFDCFSQDMVNMIFSHVNGVKRKVFNGKSPYEMFSFTYGEKITKILGIEFVPPEQVIQSPKLLKMLHP